MLGDSHSEQHPRIARKLNIAKTVYRCLSRNQSFSPKVHHQRPSIYPMSTGSAPFSHFKCSTLWNQDSPISTHPIYAINTTIEPLCNKASLESEDHRSQIITELPPNTTTQQWNMSSLCFSPATPTHMLHVWNIYQKSSKCRFAYTSTMVRLWATTDRPSPWRIHGAAIYGVPWIPSIYPLYVSINIPAPAGSVMGSLDDGKNCRKTRSIWW